MREFSISSSWVPRSAFERLAGCIFLGRTIDKARRYQQSAAAHEDLMHGYMYGENDFMDSRILRFLHAQRADVDGLVAREPDDEKVARALVERSGRSSKEVDAFSRRMLLTFGVIFAAFEADEGRRTGPFYALLRGFYDLTIYRPYAWKFRRDEEKSNRVFPS